MRFYNQQHQYSCGIDLHVRTMYVCSLDATGQVLVHRNVPSSPAALLETVAPYREDLVVAAECMFTVQEFASYARLVKCQKQSGGRTLGTSGAKMGNVHLKWAFSEAAVLFLRHTKRGKKVLTALAKKHGKGKAPSILAHKSVS